MTSRERQILQWIEENPMISQDELAEKAGISRSSVAVHISNLMKKGYIVGKGYVLSSGTYVAVVGGVNIDIGAKAFNSLLAKDSNPGKIQTSLGGVGRNIAHNISLLGIDVRMLTAFGDDEYAQRIEASCASLGIDVSHAKKVKEASTSTYLFIAGPDGDMELAVSDMSICDEITPKYLAKNLSVLNNAQIVVIDTNIPEESIAYITENCTVPIFADPVSITKAEKLKPYLGKINTLKPNKLEAELLSGVRITDEVSLQKAADVLLSTGLHRVFISLGTKGVFAAMKDQSLTFPCYESEVKNATGAGDAFMAGLCYAYLEGSELIDSASIASATAAIAVEGEETINPLMSVDAVKHKILHAWKK